MAVWTLCQTQTNSFSLARQGLTETGQTGQIGQSEAKIAMENKLDIAAASILLPKAWRRIVLVTQLKLGPVVTIVQVMDCLYLSQVNHRYPKLKELYGENGCYLNLKLRKSFKWKNGLFDILCLN